MNEHPELFALPPAPPYVSPRQRRDRAFIALQAALGGEAACRADTGLSGRFWSLHDAMEYLEKRPGSTKPMDVIDRACRRFATPEAKEAAEEFFAACQAFAAWERGHLA